MGRTNYAALALLVAALVGALGLGSARATDENVRLIDRSVAHIESGSTWIDVSAAVYTGYIVCLTVEPAAGQAMYDCKVVLDIDGGDDTNGFAEGYTSETIQFAVARKIQGKWRIDQEVESATVAGTAAANRSVTLDIGLVGPTEDVRVYVTVSTEQTDVDIPFLFMYRSGAAATFTTVSN